MRKKRRKMQSRSHDTHGRYALGHNGKLLIDFHLKSSSAENTINVPSSSKFEFIVGMTLTCNDSLIFPTRKCSPMCLFLIKSSSV
jgi:hypothetical protein